MYLLSLGIYLLFFNSNQKLQGNLGIFVHNTLHTGQMVPASPNLKFVLCNI